MDYEVERLQRRIRLIKRIQRTGLLLAGLSIIAGILQLAAIALR